LRSDYRVLQALCLESTIIRFEPLDTAADAPEVYLLHFRGTGVWKPAGSGEIVLSDEHQVVVRLGAGYPRMMPELSWKSPIFHPNISSSGFVCLGGYGTFWAPSLHLDELCVMLWDMIRYRNFDVNSPYNREAAYWARTQTAHTLPLDGRPLRDLRAGFETPAQRIPPQRVPRSLLPHPEPAPPEIVFLNEVVEAQLVPEPDQDLLIIE
jgi:hypothetical protein